MLLKNKTTKKLFYKKWLYKVIIKCPCVSYLCRYGIDYIIKSDGTGRNPYTNRVQSKIFQNKTNLLLLAVALEEILLNQDFQKRSEGDTLAIFTNDVTLVKTIQHKLKEFVTEIHSPLDTTQAEFLQQNKNKVICDELPHSTYRYKIYFKNGVKLKEDTKDSFLKWAKNFDDGRILLPESTKDILDNKQTYLYGHYFYAKDSKMTSMALMFMGDYLNKTEEYVLKSEVV